MRFAHRSFRHPPGANKLAANRKKDRYQPRPGELPSGHATRERISQIGHAMIVRLAMRALIDTQGTPDAAES